MGHRLPTRSGDEHDVVCRWPAKWLDRAGARSRIKRRMRRRERHMQRPNSRQFWTQEEIETFLDLSVYFDSLFEEQ